MFHRTFQQIENVGRIAYLMEKVINHRLPSSALIHNVMRVYVDKQYSKHIETKFYAFDGVINSKEQTFVVATQYRAFFGDMNITTSVPTNPDEIMPAMVTEFDGILDWKTKMAFKTSFEPEKIQEWCKKHGEITFVESCIPYYMQIHDAMELESRPITGFRLRMLYSRDGNDLAKIAPYTKYPSFAANMIDCIETFGGIGIYKGDQLVSSILNSTNGQLYALQVHKDFRGKRIGEWALVLMTILIASRNIFPTALLHKDDIVAQRVFEKIGFRKMDEPIMEIRYKPKPRV